MQIPGKTKTLCSWPLDRAVSQALKPRPNSLGFIQGTREYFQDTLGLQIHNADPWPNQGPMLLALGQGYVPGPLSFIQSLSQGVAQLSQIF